MRGPPFSSTPAGRWPVRAARRRSGRAALAELARELFAAVDRASPPRGRGPPRAGGGAGGGRRRVRVAHPALDARRGGPPRRASRRSCSTTSVPSSGSSRPARRSAPRTSAGADGDPPDLADAESRSRGGHGDVKEKRKGPISRAAGLAEGMANTVRRMQRDREPRVLIYDSHRLCAPAPAGGARLRERDRGGRAHGAARGGGAGLTLVAPELAGRVLERALAARRRPGRAVRRGSPRLLALAGRRARGVAPERARAGRVPPGGGRRVHLLRLRRRPGRGRPPARGRVRGPGGPRPRDEAGGHVAAAAARRATRWPCRPRPWTAARKADILRACDERARVRGGRDHPGAGGLRRVRPQGGGLQLRRCGRGRRPHARAAQRAGGGPPRAAGWRPAATPAAAMPASS